MKVRFSSSAHFELADTVDYYDAQQLGLADRFLSEVEAAVERIQEHPETWARISLRVRRCLVHRFPFALFYHLTDDEIEIQGRRRFETRSGTLGTSVMSL